MGRVRRFRLCPLRPRKLARQGAHRVSRRLFGGGNARTFDVGPDCRSQRRRSPGRCRTAGGATGGAVRCPRPCHRPPRRRGGDRFCGVALRSSAGRAHRCYPKPGERNDPRGIPHVASPRRRGAQPRVRTSRNGRRGRCANRAPRSWRAGGGSASVSASRDFWPACGHHLLDRAAAGRLLVTDEFLKAYLARPELVPPPEACAAERQLHHALLCDPRQPVAATQVAAIADADARENWEMMMAWRNHLVKHRTLEPAYLEIIRRNIKFPHILIDQLVQAILRNILDDCDDAFVVRAAEMFFRPQKLLVQEGSLLAVDEETEASLGREPRSPLVAL